MIEEKYAGSGRIIVQGHRGAMGHAPENTLVSFELGYNLGSDVIELDVHLTRDGRLAVMHDPEVSRTTDGTGSLQHMDTAEILALDASKRFWPTYRDIRVPFIEEVLAWAKGKIDLVLEIKGDSFPAEGIERLLIEKIDEAEMNDHVMVISFYHESLRTIKRLRPSIPTGILYTGRPIDPVRMTKDAQADSFRCDWRYLHRDDVRRAHEAGLWVGCWTADTEDVFTHLADMKVDSAGCNYPDRFRKWLDGKGLGIR